MSSLSDKSILIVQGPRLAAAELRAELERRGAKAIFVADVAAAFSLIECLPFDGAIIDSALQNDVFDFCTELLALYIPYTSATGPHSSQNPASRTRDAERTANRLIAAFSQDIDEAAEEWLPIDFSA